MTHAGIDGFSRILYIFLYILYFSIFSIYCWCSDNNRSDTVLDLFLKGVEKYGLPSQVRCDKGT